ncbi:hypothetical protein [Rufibacter immobilis]|uniref:hypothetical protein n=1 Tax=Rufibacter immobilis TaxID=1348778 RepID=UPI0035F0ED34
MAFASYAAEDGCQVVPLLKLRLFERQRVRRFLILLVTFLIKEKSDRRGQSASRAKSLAGKDVEGKDG